MPPKFKTSKFKKQLLPVADAEVLSDVLLRYTTTDVPDSAELPPACDAAKGEWLAQFHKNVTRKLKEGCVEEDADTTVPKVSSSNEGAEALLRLDTLTARVMVASETVRVLRTEVRHRGRTHKYIHVYVNDSRQVLPSHFTHPPSTPTTTTTTMERAHMQALESMAKKQGQSNAKKRKLAAMGAGGSLGTDAFVVPHAARATAPPLSTNNLERLVAGVEKTVNAIADVTYSIDAQSKSIKRTLQGVEKSIELRASESRSLGGTLGGQDGVVGEALTALPPMETLTAPTVAGLSATGDHVADPVRRFGNHLNG